MVSAALQSVSYAAPARAQRASASGNAELTAAKSDLDPAVVNHVGQSRAEGEEPADTEEVRKLQARDAEVRAHEQAHAAAGGALAGAASYSFERGPDGRSYAVSGEVPIDISSISDDPQATIQKMQQVKRAALAPQSPSDADRSIAASADAKISAAQIELNTGGKDKESSDSSSTSERAGDVARMAFGSDERRSAGAARYDTQRTPAAGSVMSMVT